MRAATRAAAPGIQADLKTFAAHGVFGCTAITAVTAQNTLGVTRGQCSMRRWWSPKSMRCSTICASDAIKIGMLAIGRRSSTVVSDALTRHRLPNVVLDPVMVAKGGARLLDDDAVAAIRTRLLPLADVVTPNVPKPRR